MANSDADTDRLNEQRLAAYYQLSTPDRTLVQLLSIIYEAVNCTLLVSCLKEAGVRDPKSRVFVSKILKTHLEELIAAGILVQQAGQGPQCHPSLLEVATRDAVQTQQFKTLVAVVEKIVPIAAAPWGKGSRSFANKNQLIREVRIGIYRHDLAFINKQLDNYDRYSYRKDAPTLNEVLRQVCNQPFDADWFRTLPQDLYEKAMWAILSHSEQRLLLADAAFALLQEDCTREEGRCSNYLLLILAEQLLLRNRLSEVESCLERIAKGHWNAIALQGWLSFLRGETGQAIAYYTTALQSMRKATKKRAAYFNTASGLFFVLALLQEGSTENLRQAEIYAVSIARQPNHWLRTAYERLRMVLQIQLGTPGVRELLVNSSVLSQAKENSLGMLIQALCLYWIDFSQAKKSLPRALTLMYDRAEASGYSWLATETAELLVRLKLRDRTQAKVLIQDGEVPPLADLVSPEEPWELSLKALTNLHQDPKAAPKASAEKRMAWFITFFSSKCLLQPREQKISAKGSWSKGRPISVKRLSQNTAEYDYLTSQDLRICAQIETFQSYGSYRYYGKTEYTFSERAILELIGHPLVFWEDSPTTRVEIVKGEPELLVKKVKNNRLVLQFSPPIEPEKDIINIKETPTRIKAIEIQPDHRRIAAILGAKNRLEVPAIAKERVLSAINAVSQIVTIHSDIGGVENLETVPADPKPHIHLLPAGDGLKVAVLSRPFAVGGPYFRPGKGGETAIAEIDGTRQQTTRQLQQEKQLAETAIAACPTLTRYAEQEGEWLIEDPEDCLELLLEFQTLEETVVLEWPEGEKLRVSHRADLGDFQMKLQRQRDWFAASGELKLDDTLVLDMQQLLHLLDQTPSRFVPLGDGQFLALTQTFRKRLDELRAFSEQHGKGLRFHPLATLALEDTLDEVGKLKTDKHWKAHIQKLKEMQTLQPELPSTLQAELRDYQLDGFRWLARLAHWGVGACLADDMGLGKTLQALASILTRAPEGPTLIVAPTSVCMNWISEAQRFAPTLNPLEFGSKDRQTVLDRLQPFDMLICSYGLLQQEDVADMLAKLQWQTIVLDEAQAIKNMATKRSQAAMKLQASFKLITTGTPIENHLGELWNLFRFINPGLLGSLERFNQRFAVPIEKFHSSDSRNKLKKLIQPFLLRRTKNQVLEELPSRTEILLHVELSQEEKAFYEALRRDAIDKLAGSDAKAGAKHLQVLAEIMRLRRACCNTRLVSPDTPLPSAKLDLFGEVLEELLANHHKALVFSQFVDHLQILRDHLDEQNIRYQYLDGSTPAKERKKRVNAFQSGEGDVFLISLKAGGTGLNLTAADYVIHMDPWWNPAVEDQASDRAHRIGQQRPVTIYRLVAKGTIEDKIVDLHQHKRDLADSLLEGAEMSGKMSTDELLKLIREG